MLQNCLPELYDLPRQVLPERPNLQEVLLLLDHLGEQLVVLGTDSIEKHLARVLA